MKGHSAFPKVTALLEPHHQTVLFNIQDTRCGGVLPLCRCAVGVFYSPSRLGKLESWIDKSLKAGSNIETNINKAAQVFFPLKNLPGSISLAKVKKNVLQSNKHVSRITI